MLCQILIVIKKGRQKTRDNHHVEERREQNIPLLVMHFLNKFNSGLKKGVSGISEDALKMLLNYSWPGNVRELENVIQRAVTLAQHEVILPEDLPPSSMEESAEDSFEKALREGYTLNKLEKEYIRKILVKVGGNKSKASEILGLDRKTLRRKLEEM